MKYNKTSVYDPTWPHTIAMRYATQLRDGCLSPHVRVVVQRQMACDLSPDANRWKILVVLEWLDQCFASYCIALLMGKATAYACSTRITLDALANCCMHSFLSVKYFSLSLSLSLSFLSTIYILIKKDHRCIIENRWYLIFRKWR